MPQFVVLYHECPNDVPRKSHWDLMLQEKDRLRTWVLDALPPVWLVATPPCEGSPNSFNLRVQELPPHRIDYLELEGPVSGDRGSVQRVDRGEYVLLVKRPDRIRAKLQGKRVHGVIELVRPDADTEYWQLTAWAADHAG